MKPSLPALPVSRAVRELALRYLSEASAACARLEDPKDADALHDFRVALRRLRSLARVYKPYIRECLPRKLRRRVRDLASNTGVARDTEVQLGWLMPQRSHLRSHERPGFLWMQQRLRRRMEEEYEALRGSLPRAFARLEERLVARLELHYDDSTPPFAEVAAGLLAEAGAELVAHLDRVHGESDRAEIHQARIAGKRLRYLLEPFATDLTNGKSLIKELKELQDLMGEIHDTQVFAQELTLASEEAGAARMRRIIDLSLRLPPDDPQVEAARRSDERAGLIGLAHDLQEREQDLVSRLVARLNAGDAHAFLERLHQAIEELPRLAHAGPREGPVADPAAEPDASG